MIGHGAPSEAAPEARRARNLVELLLARELSPDSLAAIHHAGEGWKEVRWGEVVQRARAVSEALVELGIVPGDRVCIFAATRLDWCVADFAIMGAGAVTAAVYASNTPAEVEHIINDSGASLVFVDHDLGEGASGGRWSRLRTIARRLPTVERFIGFDLESNPEARLLGLSDLEARGRALVEAHPHGLEERCRTIGPEDLACICYTAGTTGPSKGAMLTHGNWTYQAQAVAQAGLMAHSDVVLLFLPLAHSFGKVVQAVWLGQGFPLAFARAPETAVDDAATVKATIMPAVPRVFEKAFAKVVGDAGTLPGAKGWLFQWAMRLFDEYAAARIGGRPYDSVQWRIAKRLVFSQLGARLKARFGGHVRAFVSGSAPLSQRVALFFSQCGLTILEGYGLTETSAPTHVNRPELIRLGTVGLPLMEVETRIAEDGEVLVRGPQIMKGYFGKPDETAQVIDPEGFFHTGDLGEIDAEGCLRITDRRKDLIKTSGGKLVSPQELEIALRAMPLVSQAVIVGDRRRFVSALLTIGEEPAIRWAAGEGLPGAPFAELVRSQALRARIQAAVDEINAALPPYATIKKFAILGEDFSQQGGELTPKLSVRRKVVAQKYKSVIDALYGDEILE
jgi:long-chain acyl-CoA synthetase